jgi:hypothetical protein|nr:2OG-Fe(II) oxygenase [uncultured Steroidobacter sp.]
MKVQGDLNAQMAQHAPMVEDRLEIQFIDIAALEANKASLRQQFSSAEPYQYVVIDGFLTEFGLNSLDVEQLNTVPSTDQLSSDYLFAKNKIENPKLGQISRALEQLSLELRSRAFVRILQEICGMDVFLDPNFAGGGLHQGGAGSFLEMHADFSRHPKNREWIRELNLLLYLNRGWQKSWGGELKLVDANSRKKALVEPLENRMVIMLSKEHTLHGYDPITFPQGRLRTSVAAYAYRMDDGTSDVPYRSTVWQPTDLRKRMLAVLWNKLVPLKQRVFGSRTARRAE